MVKDKNVNDIKYETALEKLESSVKKLESGDLSLDESLKVFEDGVKWSRVCEEKLTEAKGKVEMLIKKVGGNTEIQEFSSE